MAALICVPDAQHVERKSKSAMHANLPFSVRTRWFQETAHVSPFTRYSSRSPQRCGARWHRYARIGERFFNNADGSRVTAGCAVPSSAVEVPTCSCNISVRIVCSIFSPNTAFLVVILLMKNDIMVKNDLPLRGNLRNDVREMTAGRTHPDCPSSRLAAAHFWYRGSKRK